jgi:hypothetical protein
MVAFGVELLGKLQRLRRAEFDAEAATFAAFDINHKPADNFLRLNLCCRHVSVVLSRISTTQATSHTGPVYNVGIVEGKIEKRSTANLDIEKWRLAFSSF